MKETKQQRFARLKARRQEVLGEIQLLKENPATPNREFKANRLNDEVLRIGQKIIE